MKIEDILKILEEWSNETKGAIVFSLAVPVKKHGKMVLDGGVGGFGEFEVQKNCVAAFDSPEMRKCFANL